MKKSTLIFLISTAIFFTSTLVLIYLNYLKPQSTNSIPPTSITPTQTPDLADDWNIYENKQYEYQFSCPQGSIHSIEVTSGNGLTIPLYQERCTKGKDSLKIMVYNINAKLIRDDALNSTIKTSIDEKFQIKLEGYDEKYFNSILSTFKFTDRVSQKHNLIESNNWVQRSDEDYQSIDNCLWLISTSKTNDNSDLDRYIEKLYLNTPIASLLNEIQYKVKDYESIAISPQGIGELFTVYFSKDNKKYSISFSVTSQDNILKTEKCENHQKKDIDFVLNNIDLFI